jgi:hypothetical protein
MHAEQGGSIDRAIRKGAAVPDGAPRSPSAALISTDLEEAGLWLWQGEVPPSPPSLSPPKYRDRQILGRVVPAVGWAAWIAVPAGLALAVLEVSIIPRPDRPESADAPAAALSSAPSPAVAHPIVAVPPAEFPKAQSDQVQVPSASAAKITAQTPESPVGKGRAHRKLARPASKPHAAHVRKGLLFPMPGVLTPPSVTSRGGGY